MMLTAPFLLASLTQQAALPGPLAPTRFHWLDVDRNGAPDALAIEPDGRLRLFVGDGDCAFVEETGTRGLDAFAGVDALIVGDWSGDGVADLVVSTPNGPRLARSEAGAFVDATESSGLETLGFATSLAFVDANADGRLDLHVVTDGWHRIFSNESQDSLVRFVELDFGELAAHAAHTGDVDAVRPDGTLGTVASAGLSSPSDATRNRSLAPNSPTNNSGRQNVVIGGVSGSAQSAGGGYAGSTPVGICAGSLTDQATGSCVQASSVPTLGTLYPLGNEFMIDSLTGHVGIGTTTPGYPLEVAGQLVSGTNNTPTGASSAIGGGSSNNATGEHATIAGGEANSALGDDAFIGGGIGNLVVGQRAVIGGGVGNTASNSSVVGGGEQNDAFNFATVAGGRFNAGDGLGSAIGGGANNEASGPYATVSGGGDGSDPLLGNLASGLASAIGGGQTNTAAGEHATVAGGESNNATNEHTAIGGGLGNSVFADYGTVPGGRLNVAAGVDAFAAGRRAKALHDGAFVWADSTDADFSSTAPDQFLVRASGGMGVGKEPGLGMALDVAGNIRSDDTIISTKPTGAPLSVASSDVVLNLNADHLDGFDASAFSTFGPLVDTGELADGAVTGAKIANGAIGTPQLNIGAVGPANIQNGIIGAQHLANGGITLPKLDATGGSAGQILGHDGNSVTWTSVRDASWTPIDSLPYTITAPGPYYVTADLTGVSGQNGITISANDVLLDLNGHVLTGVPGSLDGIYAFGSGQDATVIGGAVRDWDGSGMLITQGEIVNCGAYGCGQAGFYSPGLSRIVDCTAFGNGAGFFVQASTYLYGCRAAVNSSRGFYLNSSSASACVASQNGAAGFELEDSMIAGSHSVSNTSYGFQIGSNSTVRDCHAEEIGTAGFFLDGSRTRLEGNTSTSFVHVEGSQNVVVRNSASSIPDAFFLDGNWNHLESNSAMDGSIDIQGLDNLIIGNVTSLGSIQVAGVRNVVARNAAQSYSIDPGNYDAQVLTMSAGFSSTNAWANLDH